MGVCAALTHFFCVCPQRWRWQWLVDGDLPYEDSIILHVYIFIYMYVCICMSVHTYACTYVCMYIRNMHTYVCTYVCNIYIMHTQPPTRMTCIVCIVFLSLSLYDLWYILCTPNRRHMKVKLPSISDLSPSWPINDGGRTVTCRKGRVGLQNLFLYFCNFFLVRREKFYWNMLKMTLD